jgi:hypothetical protein
VVSCAFDFGRLWLVPDKEFLGLCEAEGMPDDELVEKAAITMAWCERVMGRYKTVQDAADRLLLEGVRRDCVARMFGREDASWLTRVH